MRYKRLLEPIQIGKMELKNRMVMAPMGTALSDASGLVTKEMCDYYEARAKGGAGMIIVENAGIDYPQGRQRLRALSISGPKTLDGLSRLTEVIRKNGARAAIQLHHAGRIAKSKVTGIQPVAPSAIAAPGMEEPRELDKPEIASIVNLFSDAAALAKKVGFEGVEIHAAHHYLIAQFLSGACNRRTDDYGGNLKKRTRFLLEIIRAVRKSVGDDFPVWCRINAVELGIDQGLTMAECIEIVNMIEEEENLSDGISVSAFGYGKFGDTNKPESEGALLPFAAGIKKTMRKPLMAAGMISPILGEQALMEGVADLIVLGRALIADPELPRKVCRGEEDQIRPCICCYACDDSRSSGGSIRCSVNAAAGREALYLLKPAWKAKSVCIIGGGPAGMEAARVAGLRGHCVRIYEKEAALGGQLRIASVASHKKKMLKLNDYFINQLKRLNVDVVLEREASASLIRGANVEAVVIASGSAENAPDIPGAEQIPFCPARNVLGGKEHVGEKVVILGGGMVGCEMAMYLYESGKTVAIVEQLPDLASNMRPIPRRKILEMLAETSIKVYAGVKCIRAIHEGLVIADMDGKESLIKADTVVVATGSVSDKRLFLSLKPEIPNLFQAGDCMQPRTLMEAIDEGMMIGLTI